MEYQVFGPTLLQCSFEEEATGPQHVETQLKLIGQKSDFPENPAAPKSFKKKKANLVGG